MTKAEKDECWRKTAYGLERTPKEERYLTRMNARGSIRDEEPMTTGKELELSNLEAELADIDLRAGAYRMGGPMLDSMKIDMSAQDFARKLYKIFRLKMELGLPE